MLRKIRLAVTALFWSGLAFAQSGTVKVHLIDKDTKQPLPFASVVVEKGGAQMGGGQTDIDGYAEIKPLDPGEYDVKAVYAGYQDYEITGVRVSPDKVSYLDMPLASSSQTMNVVTKVAYKVPLVDPQTKTGGTVDRQDYQNMSVKDVNSVAATTAGVYQSDVGGALNMRGARSDATQYIVDGVKLTADQALGGIPQGMVDQITTITGGTPANYGDATGGIVEINTLGASPKFFANVQGITSELLDKFGYNDFVFTVGGPLYSKRDTGAMHTKTPIVDGIIGGEYTYKKDGSPTFVGGYNVNSDVLARIQANPLLPAQGGGFTPAAAYVTANDITETASRQNIASQSIAMNGKIGIHVNNNVAIVLGGAFQYNSQNIYENVYALFDPEQNPLDITTSWRGFAKFTQRFSNTQEKNALIKNAFYTLQVDYSNTYEVTESEQFKDNLFDYGYIGQFNQYQVPTYAPGNGPKGYAYYQSGFADSLLTFTPSKTINPLEANYTSDVYKQLGQNSITNTNTIQQNFGLLNGSQPANVYSLWLNTGTAYPYYTQQNSSHFHFQADFSADISNNAIQVGFEYEQNTLRYFSVNASSLWTLMRQNTNLQISQLDLSNPILVSTGTFNTYNYNRAYNAAQQSQFDASLRQKLGLPVNGTQYLDPDSYSPSMYSLSMFSASDLLNNGGSLVSYYGYTYDGQPQSGTPSIDDFFNKKDANGNLEYPVAPYQPIYMAGWIQDHFDIKSMKFDVG
ncbi:MAG TPA: carboxypeptidase regulatory-like domain-containing protein, partial [Bacteroidia bacterium]|nr:carboxypeptidase regulatory-like domain-containing protein [Bacteroidia bacterium]